MIWWWDERNGYRLLSPSHLAPPSLVSRTVPCFPNTRDTQTLWLASDWKDGEPVVVAQFARKKAIKKLKKELNK